MERCCSAQVPTFRSADLIKTQEDLRFASQQIAASHVCFGTPDNYPPGVVSTDDDHSRRIGRKVAAQGTDVRMVPFRVMTVGAAQEPHEGSIVNDAGGPRMCQARDKALANRVGDR
jgi:hypothetical protein